MLFLSKIILKSKENYIWKWKESASVWSIKNQQQYDHLKITQNSITFMFSIMIVLVVIANIYWEFTALPTQFSMTYVNIIML